MTVYDLSFVNATNPVDLIGGINNASGGLIGIGICVVIYFIIIVGSLDHRYDLRHALLASSFIMSVVSGALLGLTNLIPSYVLGINVGILVASLMLVIFGGK